MISTAVLDVPLGEVQDVNFVLLRVSWPFSVTVSSNTAPLPLFRTILENSVWRGVEDAVRDSMVGIFESDWRLKSGEEASVIPVNETPLRVRVPEAEMEMKEEVSGVDDVFQMNSRWEMVVDA